MRNNKVLNKVRDLVQSIVIVPGNRPTTFALRFNAPSKKTKEGYLIRCPVATEVEINASLFNEAGEEIFPHFHDDSMREGGIEAEWFGGIVKLGDSKICRFHKKVTLIRWNKL
jgi:hypothetical protein